MAGLCTLGGNDNPRFPFSVPVVFMLRREEEKYAQTRCNFSAGRRYLFTVCPAASRRRCSTYRAVASFGAAAGLPIFLSDGPERLRAVPVLLERAWRVGPAWLSDRPAG